MDNIEKVEWAKNCIECLANGIQPFTGEVSENSILDDPQLIRCFFFVRDVLNEVIASGSKKKTKTEFVLTDALLDSIPIHNEKVCLTQFLNGIKEVNEGKAPKFGSIREYLIEQGLLESRQDERGKIVRYATDKAKQHGIENEERVGSNGRYTVVVYDTAGQQYLVECIKKMYAQ